MSVNRSDRKYWRVPGLPPGYVLVRREDVADGEEPTAVPEVVLDHLLEPLESVTHAQVIEICESLHPGSIRPFRTWSVRERQTWVRRVLSEAISNGVLTMVQELPDKPSQPLLIGPTVEVGPHPAWTVENFETNSESFGGVARVSIPGRRRATPSGSRLLLRRQDVQHGDRIVVGSPQQSQLIAESLFRPECEKARLEILQSLGLRPDRLNQVDDAPAPGKSARNRRAGVGLAGGACRRRQPGGSPRAAARARASVTRAPTP